MHIPRKVENGIREVAPNADITFERVAVTPEQITSLRLPNRPTKRTDSRSKRFVGESVEVDAIPPKLLRRMGKECITRHIDERAYGVLKKAEQSERETLMSLLGKQKPKRAFRGLQLISPDREGSQ